MTRQFNCKRVVEVAQQAYFARHYSGKVKASNELILTPREKLNACGSAIGSIGFFEYSGIDGQKRAVVFLERVLNAQTFEDLHKAVTDLMQGQLRYNVDDKEPIAGKNRRNEKSFLTFLEQEIKKNIPGTKLRDEMLAIFQLQENAPTLEEAAAIRKSYFYS